MSSLAGKCGLVCVDAWREQMQMTEVRYKLRRQTGRTAGDDRGLETTKDVPPVWAEGTVRTPERCKIQWKGKTVTCVQHVK